MRFFKNLVQKSITDYAEMYSSERYPLDCESKNNGMEQEYLLLTAWYIKFKEINNNIRY
jgi:hypothetical protein